MLPGPEASVSEVLAYFPGFLLDKLVTILQVCVSHPCSLGIVGHLCSPCVRASVFAECKRPSMSSVCESLYPSIWITNLLVSLDRGGYEGQAFGFFLIGLYFGGACPLLGWSGLLSSSGQLWFW